MKHLELTKYKIDYLLDICEDRSIKNALKENDMDYIFNDPRLLNNRNRSRMFVFLNDYVGIDVLHLSKKIYREEFKDLGFDNLIIPSNIEVVEPYSIEYCDINRLIFENEKTVLRDASIGYCGITELNYFENSYPQCFHYCDINNIIFPEYFTVDDCTEIVDIFKDFGNRVNSYQIARE